MNKHILRVAGITFLLVVAVVTPVAAQAATSGSGTSAKNSSSSQATGSAPSTTTLSQRLATLKSEYGSTLLSAQITSLKAHCKGAQGKIVAIAQGDSTVASQRDQAFQTVDTSLTTLVNELSDGTINTAKLKTEQAALESKIAAYHTERSDYIQTLNDINTMDCVASPTTFQAALTGARSMKITLAKGLLGIHTYIAQTITPTLASLKQEVSSLSSNSTSNTSTSLSSGSSVSGQ